MTGLLLTNARVVSADAVLGSGWLTTSGTVIEALGAGQPPAGADDGRHLIDLDGATVLPGFVDVHVHGAMGHEVMDATVEGLTAMSAFFASHGVTAFLPTTWSASTGETMDALLAVAQVRSDGVPGAQVLGAHMEGPYLNSGKCGAQDPRAVRLPDLEEARLFLGTGAVRLITLAPELARGRELVHACLDAGVRVSAGHTEATFDQIAEAVSWGVRHVTHTFNAMPPLHHRNPGPVGAVMTMPELLAELIADNLHVHPVVQQALVRVKGVEGVVLVTDALRPTGLEAGEFAIGGRRATLVDGVVRLDDDIIVGSVLTMDVALRNLVRATGLPFESLWRAASRNGAVAAGAGERKGLIARGMDADLVVVGQDVDVRLTVVCGQVVYSALAPVGAA